jgi:nucleotide-binding universal stress UspA family protein
VDGSTFAEQALPLALSLARRSGASLHLIHVLQPLASVYAEAPLFVESACDLEARIQERFRTYLDALATGLAKRRSTVVTSSLLEGEVVPSILAHAAETQPDLVVMTTHGRGPLGRFWLGSVADELARVLPVPLLLVRPQAEAATDLEIEPLLKQIVIPLDGSALAEQIIQPAVELGRLTGAGFTLLKVLKPAQQVAFPTGSPMLDVEAQTVLSRIETIQGQLRKEAMTYLEGIADPLRADGLDVVCKIAIDERPEAAILQEAASKSVNLVALETHGRRGLSRLLLGSVADKVIRGTTVPVLINRPGHG